MGNEGDLIETALRSVNTWNRIQQHRAGKRLEREGREKKHRVREEARVRLRPVARKAKEIFRRALIPHGMGNYVKLEWTGIDTDDAISFVVGEFCGLSLGWNIFVGPMTLSGHFYPRNIEDCQAEAWRVWGIVEQMLQAHINNLPSDVAQRLEYRCQHVKARNGKEM